MCVTFDPAQRPLVEVSDDSLPLTSSPLSRPAYHWDISDWVPSSKLSSFEEAPGYRAAASARPGDAAHELESDYYLGGYDIDSDCPSSHVEEFLSEEPLPPPLPADEDLPELYMPITSVSSDSTLSSGQHPSQKPPTHHLPPEESPQGPAGARSCTPAPEKPRRPSDSDSMEELREGVTYVTDSEQQTKV